MVENTKSLEEMPPMDQAHHLQQLSLVLLCVTKRKLVLLSVLPLAMSGMGLLSQQSHPLHLLPLHGNAHPSSLLPLGGVIDQCIPLCLWAVLTLHHQEYTNVL